MVVAIDLIVVKRILLAVAFAAATALLLAPSSSASYPGRNGLMSLRGDAGGHSQLFTIDAKGQQLTQLTHLTDGDVNSAAHWTPDMKHLTFEVDPTNHADGDCRVALLPATGGTPTLLPLANGDMCEAAPTFSANGKRIIYEGFNGKRDALYRMNLDGSNRQLVTKCQGGGVTSPEASPNGRLLAFTCSSKTGSALFVSRPDGSHLKKLTPYSMQVGFHEDFSPDSRRIVFITTTDEDTPKAHINTYTIGVHGGGLVQLTHFPAGGLRAYGNSYSPDGKLIVLRIEKNNSSGSGFQSALFTMPAGGGAMTQLTAYSDFRPRGMVWGTKCPCTP